MTEANTKQILILRIRFMYPWFSAYTLVNFHLAVLCKLTKLFAFGIKVELKNVGLFFNTLHTSMNKYDEELEFKKIL